MSQIRFQPAPQTQSSQARTDIAAQDSQPGSINIGPHRLDNVLRVGENKYVSENKVPEHWKILSKLDRITITESGSWPLTEAAELTAKQTLR